jgi:NTP pyrophosphatase (non-canonical NTP hydrolase)
MMSKSIDELISLIEAMRLRHQWHKSDSPNVLSKSIVVEANELLECFLNDEFDREEVGSELADILMYTLSLVNDLGFDVYQLVEEKISDVDRRY